MNRSRTCRPCGWPWAATPRAPTHRGTSWRRISPATAAAEGGLGCWPRSPQAKRGEASEGGPAPLRGFLCLAAGDDEAHVGSAQLGLALGVVALHEPALGLFL